MIEKISDSFSGFFRGTKVRTGEGKFMFVKPGPYETDFKDRITKFYLTVNGKEFNGIKNFLKSKMGVG